MISKTKSRLPDTTFSLIEQSRLDLGNINILSPHLPQRLNIKPQFKIQGKEYGFNNS